MRLWLASSDLDQIEELCNARLFAGLITNPDLIASVKKPPRAFFEQVAARTSCEMFYQVRGSNAVEMIEDAELFAKLAPNRMIIKVPATPSGLRVIPCLTQKGIRVAATCIPTSALAVVAESLGAHYLIPWGSMLSKRGIGDRETLIAEIIGILRSQASRSEIIVGAYGASDLVRLARLGARNVFVWEKDIDAIFRQPLAEEAVATFQESWRIITNAEY